MRKLVHICYGVVKNQEAYTVRSAIWTYGANLATHVFINGASVNGSYTPDFSE